MELSLFLVLPILLLLACAVGLAVGLLIVSNVFNPGRSGNVTRMPYESGMDPIHDTRRRFDIRFYLLAIAFLVFDVELLFLYPWAVASRPAVVDKAPPETIRSASPRSPASPAAPLVAPVGIEAAVAAQWVQNRHIVFGGAMLFVVLLALGFVYDWRKGVFQWR